MPYPGGVVDQPHDAIVRIETILRVINDIQENESKRQEALARAKASKQ